jgi:hypothetical protein
MSNGAVKTLAVSVAGFTMTSCAYGYASFRTPHRDVYCGVSEGEPPIGLICWRPRTGLDVGMLAHGRATHGINRRDRGLYQDLAPVLRYGHTWRERNLFRCTSGRNGLTCRNRAGHGWFIARTKGYRIF